MANPQIQILEDVGLPSEINTAAQKNSSAKKADRLTISLLSREVHRAYGRALQERIAPFGINLGQWLFLKTLWDEDGLTQRELSRRVGMMEPTTVTALNGMERRGLVTRVRNTNDRRKSNVFLTEKAQALRPQLLQVANTLQEKAIEGIAQKDVQTVLNALQKVIQNLGQGH